MTNLQNRLSNAGRARLSKKKINQNADPQEVGLLKVAKEIINDFLLIRMTNKKKERDLTKLILQLK